MVVMHHYVVVTEPRVNPVTVVDSTGVERRHNNVKWWTVDRGILTLKENDVDKIAEYPPGTWRCAYDPTHTDAPS